jgi:hypothetical protein
MAHKALAVDGDGAAERRGDGMTPRPSRASNELDVILHEEGPLAESIRKHFTRTHLWRLRTGRRRPDIDGMVLLRKLTRGRIILDWWAEEKFQERCAACGRAG